MLVPLYPLPRQKEICDPNQWSQLLPTVLRSAWRGALATLDVTTPCVLEARMPYHSIALEEETIESKAFKCSRSYYAETHLGFTVQKISKAETALAEAAIFAPRSNLVSLNKLFHYKKKRIPLLSKRDHGFASRDQLHFYFMERAPSTTGLMQTLKCGTDLRSWTLNFGLSHISIWTTSFRQFPTKLFSQRRRAGLELLSTRGRQPNR